MNRSNENLFVNKHEMMNVFQIAHVIDSIKKRQKESGEKSQQIGTCAPEMHRNMRNKVQPTSVHVSKTV